MIGKHYVLTGGTSGLGQSLLEILLSKQVHVTVLARNPQKIKKKYDSSLLTVIKCDLQSQERI